MAPKKPASCTPPSRRSGRIEKRVKIKEEQKPAAATSTKPKRLRRARQRKSCHLLNLPGELRNRIYELVVRENPLFIETDGPAEPNLLRTCRRIRSEAGSIYYASNEIVLMIEGYNGADFMPFTRQARKFGSFWRNDEIHFLFDDAPDWDNVVAWIKACHTQGALTPEWSELPTSSRRLVANAFKLASDCGHWSWERKEEMLNIMYDSLRGTSSPFVQRGDRIY